jgi:hypothetical protein
VNYAAKIGFSPFFQIIEKILPDPLDSPLETQKTEGGRSASVGADKQNNPKNMKTKTTMTHPILILKKIPGSNTADDPNYYGYKTILIWQFNFDGEGSALVSYDDDLELDSIFGEDLQHILFGDSGSGHRWYRPVNLNVPVAKNGATC